MSFDAKDILEKRMNALRLFGKNSFRDAENARAFLLETKILTEQPGIRLNNCDRRLLKEVETLVIPYLENNRRFPPEATDDDFYLFSQYLIKTLAYYFEAPDLDADCQVIAGGASSQVIMSIDIYDEGEFFWIERDWDEIAVKDYVAGVENIRRSYHQLEDTYRFRLKEGMCPAISEDNKKKKIWIIRDKSKINWSRLEALSNAHNFLFYYAAIENNTLRSENDKLIKTFANLKPNDINLN